MMQQSKTMKNKFCGIWEAPEVGLLCDTCPEKSKVKSF